MNYRTMAKGALALSLSLIVGVASAADQQKYGATFEPAINATNDYAYVDGSNIGAGAYRGTDNGNAYGWFQGSEDDESIVTNQYLLLNTDASTLTNKFSDTVAGELNTAIAADGAYFETEVKFVASDSDDAGIEGGQDATKFAIYAYHDDADESNPTNLVVFHAYYDPLDPALELNGGIGYTNEVISSVNIDVTKYTKIRVEMKQVDVGGEALNIFAVSVDGGEYITSPLAYQENIWFLTTEAAVLANKAVSSLNFKGTGEIDNINVGVITTTPPADTNWKIEGFNPAPAVWPLPVATAADNQTIFYSNIVVNADDDTGGRPVVGAWVGVSVIAPEAVTSENVGTWYFNVYGNGTKLTQSPVQFSGENPELENGHYVLHDWFGITPTNIRNAIAEQRSIVYAFEFFQSDPTVNQTLTIDISPKNIQLNANGVQGAEDLKVIDWAEQPKVTWTVENVTVTTNGSAAAQGFFAPATVLTFTPDTGLAITNIDGVAVSYAANAAFTLTVTQATNITVLAGTVSSEREKPAWAANADDNKFWAWVDLYNVDYSTDYTAQYLMNVDPSKTPVLKIDSIAVTADGSQIVVSATDGTDAIDLAAINGVLNVSVGSSVSALTSKAIPENNVTFASNKATVIIKTADGAFAKATVDFTAPESSLTAVAAQ